MTNQKIEEVSQPEVKKPAKKLVVELKEVELKPAIIVAGNR